MRRSIGEHMKRSLEVAATCTTWIEVDMSRVERARAAMGLTALPFVARCAIDALREFPSLNAWLDGETFTQHEAVNLGIAFREIIETFLLRGPRKGELERVRRSTLPI